MKPWLRLLIAVLVLAAVVGVLYWPHKPAATVTAAPLVKVNANDVRAITITQPGQPTAELTKAGSDWKLTQPYAYAADGAAVSSLLDSLGNITTAQDVGSATNLAAFGLDHPSTVTLGLADGKSLEFDFGADTPTGGNTYLRLGAAGPIKMAPSEVKSAALKSAFLLQDKAILHFPSGQLTALDASAGGKKVHLDRTKDTWPKDQQSNVQSLLDALADGQMTAMVTATPNPAGKDAAADGLAHPTSTLTLTWNGGSATLEIGAKKGAAEYFARNSAGPSIFTLSDYLVTDIANLVTPPKALSVAAPAK